MTVAKRISLVSATLVAFSLVMGLLGVVLIHSIDSNLQSILVDSLPGVEAIGKMDGLASNFRGNAWKHMSLDAARKADVEREMEKYKADFGKAMAEYEQTITTDEDRQLFQSIPPAFQEFMAAWEGPKALSREGKTPEAVALYMEKGDPALRKFMAAINAEVVFNSSNAKKNAVNVANVVSVARFWIWLLGAASIGAGCLVAFFTVRGIDRTLVSVAEELTNTAAQVAAASAQVAQSSQDLASGSSEQAASIEETSASTEELTSMTRKNADNAENASKLMGQTVANVETLNVAHSELGHAIAEVNASSDKISKIIKVIDEIAFQTNILALNAAVEAARAGEAGQGFAVVADEVRNLAHRSADAAKETAALIEESITKARDGKVKLDQALRAVEANNTLSLQVKTNTDEVNLGSQEQAKGLEQIARAISQMESVVQKTAASAEEGASAGAELSNQAQALRSAVDRLHELVG